MRKAQNTEPKSVEENCREAIQNNSSATGKINEIETSENPEKMDIDNAEPGKEVAEKEVKEAETRKDAKRRDRAAQPKEEPEYFEETPNLRELLDNSIYEYNWSFRNLEEAFENGDEKQDGVEIREESEKHKGILANKEVYLFWGLERQPLTFQDKEHVVIIPFVVAVVLPFPPSDKLVIPLVQNESEEIVPMTKMDWITYISSENRAVLKHLKEDRVTTSPYCSPYYQLLKEEYFEETEIEISYPDTKTPIICSFDWEFDELEEFTDMLIEEDRLTLDKKEAFKEFVNKKVGEAKEAIQQAKDARKKKASGEMNEETRTALNKGMKFYKFYPVRTSDSPDVFVSRYINRYYGRAHDIFC